MTVPAPGTHAVVYVVEVIVPDEESFAAMHDAAQVVMSAVTTATNLPSRAWVTVNDTAAQVLALVAT